MTTLLDKLQEKESVKKTSNVAFWKPEIGDILQGTVQDIGSTITQYGDRDYIQILTQENESFMVILNQVLQKSVEEEEVVKGDTIAIKYLGMVQSKKNQGKAYNNFVLAKE